MGTSVLGNSVRRVEDPAFLGGASRYVADIRCEGMLHVAFVRAEHAHATLDEIDLNGAPDLPGVVRVYTGDTIAGLPPVPQPLWTLNEGCERRLLATDRVRFVGEPVAAVVATSRAEADDAAAAIIVTYGVLPAIVDPEAALDDGAFLQFEGVPSNLVASISTGDDAPMAHADIVVRGRFVNQRVAVTPLEGNGIVVQPEDPLLVTVSTQMPHLFAAVVAQYFALSPGSVRVIAPDVGGAFGSKVGLSPEHAMAIVAALDVNRPVSWIESRSENLVAMPHGRGQIQYAELGLTRQGLMVGLRCRIVGDCGAYGGFGGYLPMHQTRYMASGVYRIPKVSFDVAIAATNTTPMGGFRGAGRPEATAMLERLVDLAAAELGLDAIDLRRRNMLRPDEFPYVTPTGMRYDSGDYARALDAALEIADRDGLVRDQRGRIEAGSSRLLGIGTSVYVEVTGGSTGGGQEDASVTIAEDGTATVTVGTSAHGQGHVTTFSMIVADCLGIGVDDVQVIQSDTGRVATGGGTGGSRSMQLGGSAIASAAAAVLEQAKELAADDLEAAVDDIVLTENGALAVSGVPARSRTWRELHQLAVARGERLSAQLRFSQEHPTFPFGAHVAVIEVDVETGHVTLLRHVAVDDCGTILNPLLVAGQQHGGMAQGISQVLWEQVVYDDDGNPLTTTLAEYGFPSAAELPSFDVANTVTPTPLNPLGAKGIGESGTVGATPAVQNAIVNALHHLGVRHVDLPCTAERVWRAVQDARGGTLPPVWSEPPTILDRIRRDRVAVVPDESDHDDVAL